MGKLIKILEDFYHEQNSKTSSGVDEIELNLNEAFFFLLRKEIILEIGIHITSSMNHIQSDDFFTYRNFGCKYTIYNGVQKNDYTTNNFYEFIYNNCLI